MMKRSVNHGLLCAADTQFEELVHSLLNHLKPTAGQTWVDGKHVCMVLKEDGHGSGLGVCFGGARLPKLEY